MFAEEEVTKSFTSAYWDTATPFPPAGRVPVIGKGSAEKDRRSSSIRLEVLLVTADGCTQARHFLDISTCAASLASIFGSSLILQASRVLVGEGKQEASTDTMHEGDVQPSYQMSMLR